MNGKSFLIATRKTRRLRDFLGVPGAVRRYIQLALPLFFISATTVLSFVPLMPRSAGHGVTETVFSAERAMKHIEVIAQSPHPLGSRQQATVRQYLLDTLTALGLQPEVQAFHTVQNVMARIPGTTSSDAIVLMAHYDSVSVSPGAADNASGTVVILETARALLNNPPLKNDVILLITDGEESGLQGSTAFIEHHPWMDDVKVVLNFDTFTRGPATLWQLSPQNGWLVQQAAQSGIRPVVAPYLYSKESAIPYSTDLDPFLNQQGSGYNFWTTYSFSESHTAADRIDIVTTGSIQSAGDQALGLTRHLGAKDLSETKAPDETYFNLGPWFIHYPVGWGMALNVLGVVGAVGVLVLGWLRQRLSWRGLILGTLLASLGLLVASLGMFAIWQMIDHHAFRTVFEHMKADLDLLGTSYPWQHTPHDFDYFIGFEGATLIAGFIIYLAARKWFSLSQIMGIVVSIWLALLVAAAILFDAVSYMFVGPTLASALILALSYFQISGWSRLFWYGLALLAAAPVILVWGPAIYLFFMGTALGYLAVLVPATMLLAWTILPQFDLALALLPGFDRFSWRQRRTFPAPDLKIWGRME
ncbi:MAG: M28 family peptidase [Chloroflexi bacterium]|nr:M28 family peptidase [Chloroflexota bacterium]